MNSPYVEHQENLRVVDTGKSKFKIVRESGTGLWSIETDTGPLPVQLRDKKYTRHQFALIDIEVYLNGHAERKVIYGKKKEV